MLRQKLVLTVVVLAVSLAACEGKKPQQQPLPPSAPSSSTAEPASPATEPAPAAPTPVALASSPAETGQSVAATDAGQGKAVYAKACVTCHGTGVAGAPKLDDKSAWAARIAQGMDTLYTHAIKGFQGKTGVMPPKGGFASLTDAEVKAAVDYMVSQAR